MPDFSWIFCLTCVAFNLLKSDRHCQVMRLRYSGVHPFRNSWAQCAAHPFYPIIILQQKIIRLLKDNENWHSWKDRKELYNFIRKLSYFIFKITHSKFTRFGLFLPSSFRRSFLPSFPVGLGGPFGCFRLLLACSCRRGWFLSYTSASGREVEYRCARHGHDGLHKILNDSRVIHGKKVC